MHTRRLSDGKKPRWQPAQVCSLFPVPVVAGGTGRQVQSARSAKRESVRREIKDHNGDRKEGREAEPTLMGND